MPKDKDLQTTNAEPQANPSIVSHPQNEARFIANEVKTSGADVEIRDPNPDAAGPVEVPGGVAAAQGDTVPLPEGVEAETDYPKHVDGCDVFELTNAYVMGHPDQGNIRFFRVKLAPDHEDGLDVLIDKSVLVPGDYKQDQDPLTLHLKGAAKKIKAEVARRKREEE